MRIGFICNIYVCIYIARSQMTTDDWHDSRDMINLISLPRAIAFIDSHLMKMEYRGNCLFTSNLIGILSCSFSVSLLRKRLMIISYQQFHRSLPIGPFFGMTRRRFLLSDSTTIRQIPLCNLSSIGREAFKSRASLEKRDLPISFKGTDWFSISCLMAYWQGLMLVSQLQVYRYEDRLQ